MLLKGGPETFFRVWRNSCKLYSNVNETPTKQFLTIEQNVQQNRQIKEIKSLHDQMHTEPKDICNSFKEFYETLCSSKPTCLDTQNTFLEYVKSLAEESKKGRTGHTNNFGRSKKRASSHATKQNTRTIWFNSRISQTFLR